MKRTYRGALVCMLMLVLLSIMPVVAKGASEISATATARTAVDALGRTVTVEETPKRIVVVGRAAVMPADALFLFPAAREMEIVLARTNQGLGDFFNLIRPEFALQQRLGQQVSAEQILAVSPDLVLTKSSNYDSVVTQLEPFGVPVFVMDLESAQSWKDEITQLGILLGDPETPKRVIGHFETRERSVDDAIATLSAEDKPSVLMMQVAAADGVTAFSVSPRAWIQTYLVERSGGVPVWLDASLAENAWRKVSFEQIAVWNPDNMYLISYREPAGTYIREIESNDQWGALQAVQNGTLTAVPADVMSYFQSDSRWILALQWLAADLHPELFPDFDMEAEIASFYRDFYGIEDQHIIETLLDSYRSSIDR